MSKKGKQGSVRAANKSANHSIDPATRRGLISIGVFALALIVTFSLFGWAGTLGQGLNFVLTAIVGLGRYALPIFLLIIVYNLIYPREEELELSPLFGIGLALMAASVFGLFDVIQAQSGGYIGIALTYLFRTYVSVGVAVVVFVALFLMSLLIVFNTSLQHLAQYIPARSMLGKSLRFMIALFGSAKQRIAIAKEQALASVAEQEPIEVEDDDLEDDANEVEDDDDEATDVEAFTQRSLEALAQPTPTSTKTRQMKLVRVPHQHRKIDLPIELLSGNKGKPTSGDIEHNKDVIIKTLANFGIEVELGPVNVGPTVTQYSFRPASGVKVSQIVSLQNDIALALAAHPIRIEAPIPGKSLVGIEVPNIKAAQVGLRELLEAEEFKQRKSNLTLAFGKDVSGKCFTGDLTSMPHMLIAGATGSGKSVCMNTVLISLLYQNGPDDLKVILVDPKRVEFSMYNDIPHLLTPVITDVQKTINALQWTVHEMDRRYEVLAQAKRRDIGSYNTNNPDNTMPYIVFVIDELADLMATAPREVEAAIVRLAQMARAVGIHLVLATQRPSVDVITGLIKANITTRCAFSTASVVDSRTILDMAGAEKLLGRGDMLYMSTDSSKPRRLQGAFVSEEEVNHVTSHLKGKAKPDYDTEVVTRTPGGALPQAFMDGEQEDDLLPAAKKVIVESQKASASLLQRRLRVGYARAARLLDILEEQGFIGPADGAKPREILAEADAWLNDGPTDQDIPTPQAYTQSTEPAVKDLGSDDEASESNDQTEALAVEPTEDEKSDEQSNG